MSNTTTEKYFASLGPNELASELMKRAEAYYDYLMLTGRMTLWRRTYEYYYRGVYRGGKVAKVGPQQQYYAAHFNHYRNLLQHMIIMTTSQKPSWEPRATNTDYKSLAQVKDASGILDYFMREKRMENNSKQGVEDTVVYGEGYVVPTWDTALGEPYTKDPQTGKIIKTGDIEITNYTPVDVIRDPTLPAYAKQKWWILRDYENKWDLAARYPSLKDKILDLSYDQTRKFNAQASAFIRYDTEQIPVFKFFHAPTDAMPEGRIYEFLSSEVWLTDAKLPYKKVPIYRCSAAEQRGTNFGYTIGWDLLPGQEMFDTLTSTIFTNQALFGVQNITMPVGTPIKGSETVGGLKILRYDPKLGKPEALNLVQSPAEIFKMLDMINALLETISGINSVARGHPEASLKSGSALALVQSMAIQFSSGLQQTYSQLLEDMGTGVINILKGFANAPRLMTIAGKSNMPYMLEFTGKDLADIDRVTVDLGNPLARTTAGKVQMAEDLLKAGLIDAEQYIQVMKTGNLETATEGKQAELLHIRDENERLVEGQEVVALATDAHALHIHEHKVVLASTEARKQPDLVRRATEHIMAHINLLRQTDPGLLAVLGEKPIPPPLAGQPVTPGQMTGMPQGPGASGAPAPKGPSRVLDATNPVEARAGRVILPGMPKNALTGQTFNPTTGGL